MKRRFLGILLGLIAAALPIRVQAANPPVETDVFVSGKEGYHTYRIPAVVLTKQGTLLAFCEGRRTGRADHGDLDLVLRRSLDLGKSWQPMQLVHEEGGDAKVTIGNPCPVVDQATGTIWLPFCRDNLDVFVTSSSDDGVTWSKPRNITADVKRSDWGWYATGPVNGIQLTRGPHAGRLVIPCDHRIKDTSDKRIEVAEGGRSHVIYSDDHGQNWKLGGITELGMNECSVAELADGRLMLNMRSYRGKARRGITYSSDGGLTWSSPIDDPALIEPVCQGSLLRYRFPDTQSSGVLLFCNPANEKNRSKLTVRLSEDDGKTWPIGKLLCEGSSAYSCLTVLPDGRVGVLYEKDNYGRIVFAAFGFDWLRSRE